MYTTIETSRRKREQCTRYCGPTVGGIMITISATKLRNNLFDYLNKVADGETIVIQRNDQEVARLLPVHQLNWRNHMSIKPKLLVSPDELIKPIDDIWEDYV